MVIKLYISGISGNKEVKKKQQRVQMILDSKQISYEAIDITEPGKEKDKEFMQQNGKIRESLGKHPLPPQIFNDDDFCGDYEDFDMANEVDELEKFLHIETKDSENGVKDQKIYKIFSKIEAMDFDDADIKLITELLHDSNNEDSQSVKSKKSGNVEYDPYNYHTVTIKWDRVNGVQEQIIVNDESVDENKEIGETIKSEVNGEFETVTPSQPEMNLDTEASNENVPAPEKEEEVPAEENNGDEKAEENTEMENKEEDVEVEEKDAEEEVDKAKEEEAEKEEESPQVEEEEENEEKNEKEESEKEEDEESGRESPQSEKSEDD